MSTDSSSLPPPYPPPQATQTPISNPPASDRRPRRFRAREVSSRYLSPSPTLSSYSAASCSSYSSETLHRPAFLHNALPAPSLSFSLLSKKHYQQKPDHWSHAYSPDPLETNENQPIASTLRTLETPLPAATSSAKPSATLKKRTVVRLFAENNATSNAADQAEKSADRRRVRRPGTPIPHQSFSDDPRGVRANRRPPTPARVNLFPLETGTFDPRSSDTRLGETPLETSLSDSESVSSHGEVWESSPLHPPVACRARPVAEVRSSMPAVDLRRTTEQCSSWQEAEAADDSSCRASTNSLCLHSLNSAVSGHHQQQQFSLSKSVNRPLFSSKPPQPPPTNLANTVERKERKAFIRQENIHLLRLLDNHFLQWRFINAKARGTADAQRIAAEKSLLGVSARISDLRSSVSDNRIKLEGLKRKDSLLTIIHGQMPHLDKWATLEDDHSSSLLGVTNALHDASLRIPIIGNVTIDTTEIKQILNSALLVLKSSFPCVAKLIPKAKDVDAAVSELASVISFEQSLVGECGNLLSEAHNLQMMECSLRSQIIQEKQHSLC